MYNDQLVYNVVIWAFFGISLWTEKVALTYKTPSNQLSWRLPVKSNIHFEKSKIFEFNNFKTVCTHVGFVI